MTDNLQGAKEVLEAQLLSLIQKKNEHSEKVKQHAEVINEVDKILVDLNEEERAFLEKMRERRAKQYDKKQGAQSKMSMAALAEREAAQQIAELKKKLDDLASQAATSEQLNKIKQMVIDEFGDRKWWTAATDYQKEDIIFFCSAFLSGQNGVLNANVMGSGKTLEQAANIEIMTWLFSQRYSHFNRLPRILWMTKVSLLDSSHAELTKWNEKNLFTYIQGTPAERTAKIDLALTYGAVVMVNYDMLNSTPRLMEVEWDFVFIDEVHQLKGGANPSGPTARFVNTRNLLRIEKINEYKYERVRKTETDDGEIGTQLPFLSMLSATPVQNRPEEVWCYLHLFDPQIFPTLRQFMRGFVDWYGGFQPAKLLETLQGRFIRQDPELIYASRPDKDHMIVEVEMTPAQRKIFENALNYVLSSFDEKPDEKANITAVIAKLTRCRQIGLWPPSVKVDGAGSINVRESGKIDAAMEILEQLFSDNEQCVVWTAQFNAPLEVIYERVTALGKKAAYITGATKNPGEVERQFQNGEIDVLLCNMKAAGEGYNFNKNPGQWSGGASNAIFLDLWYNPQVNVQAEDRIWRTGAPVGVKIWILHDPNSIDAFIKELCDEKQQMFDDIIEQAALQPKNHDWKNLLTGLIKGDGKAAA